jgi:hypothetical protein
MAAPVEIGDRLRKRFELLRSRQPVLTEIGMARGAMLVGEPDEGILTSLMIVMTIGAATIAFLTIDYRLMMTRSGMAALA